MSSHISANGCVIGWTTSVALNEAGLYLMSGFRESDTAFSSTEKSVRVMRLWKVKLLWEQVALKWIGLPHFHWHTSYGRPLTTTFEYALFLCIAALHPGYILAVSVPVMM